MIDLTVAYLNGVEFSNAHRVFAYVEWARGQGVFTDCEPWFEWGQVNDACWQDAATFVSPAADPAPWYDPDEPESAEFLGFWLTKMDGLDQVVQARKLTPRIGEGAVAGRRSSAGRTVAVEAVMYATSKLGMEFGQRWLSTLLVGDDECATTQGTLLFRAACPPNPPAAGTDLRRYLTGVSVLDSKAPLKIHDDDGPSCAHVFQTVSFTLGSESSDVFTYPEPGAGFENLPIALGSRTACNAPITCCDASRDLGRHTWRSSFGRGRTGIDPVPVITIVNGSADPLYRFRIEAFASEGGECFDMAPLSDAFQCRDPFTAMEVGTGDDAGLPAGAVLVLSGVTGRATVFPEGLSGPSADGGQYVNPAQTAGVRGLKGLHGGVCIVGAASALGGPVDPAVLWSVTWQYRLRQA